MRGSAAQSLYTAMWISLFLIAWEVTARIYSKSFYPPPSIVAARIYYEMVSGHIIVHMVATLARIFLGLGMATLFGVSLGILSSRRIPAGNPFRVAVLASYPIPHTTLIPLLIWFFDVELGKIALITLICLYPIAISTMEWASRTPRSYVEVIKSVGGGSRHILALVTIPSTLPGILTGVRIASSTAYAVSYIAESFVESRGLGYMINFHWHTLDYIGVYASISILALLGIATYGSLYMAERRALRWIYAG
jgi:NitT/TauT family transport system permease protein